MAEAPEKKHDQFASRVERYGYWMNYVTERARLLLDI